LGVYYPDMETPYPVDALPVARALRGLTTENLELFFRTALMPDGVFLNVNGRPILDEDGTLRGTVSTFLDVTELRNAHRETERLTVTDPLTGIANRRAFEQRI